MRPIQLPILCATVALLIGCGGHPTDANTPSDDWLLGHWSGDAIGYSRLPVHVEMTVTRGQRITPGLSGNVTERGLLVTGFARDPGTKDSISFQTLASFSPAETGQFRFSFATRGLNAFPNLSTSWPGGCASATYSFGSIDLMPDNTSGRFGMFVSGQCDSWRASSQSAPSDGGTIDFVRS